MKTLYRKDTKGKIRVLIISTEGADLVQKSGCLDGKLIEHRKSCKAKNVGRSNATTAEQQAIAEMNSKVKDELSGGYYETIEEAQNSLMIFPMLAKDYNEEKDKIAWGKESEIYIQPKFDGMRCLAFVSKDGSVRLMSRDGKIIKNMAHIEKELSQVKEDIIFDGELYKHGSTFQENMSLIKRYQEGFTEGINYYIYDTVSDKPFPDRFHKDIYYCNIDFNFTNYLRRVTTLKIFYEEELKEYHANFLSLGYEGTMVRHGNDHYKVKARSSSLLKYKDFIDIAVPVIDIIPGEQRPEWGTPVLFTEDGKRFEAGTRMTHEQRIELLVNKDKYIGRTAEIRFFSYTDGGIPRFPVLVGFRLDK